MKKFYSWMTVMAVALSFGFASCSDSDDEPEPEPVAAPELLSFEFKAADNAEVLSADYAGVISTVDKTVKVTMPAFADKSSLVATFTVGEGNTVTVSGVTQQSGVTANDFTVPVDYIVSNSDGSQNIKFTVTVEKAADYVWSEVARFNAVVPRSGNAIMKLNAVDNTPYVAFVNKATEKVAVLKYDNGAFANVGTVEGVSEKVTSGRMDFAVSNTGTPYFIYSDGSITAPVKSAASVMKFDGSAWSHVGQQGIAGFVPSKVQIGAIGNDVIASMIVNGNNGSFQKREVYSSIFKGGNWETNSLSTAGVNNANIECLTTTDNAAYLYSISAATYKYSVSEYKNGVWTSLRNEYLESGATQAPILMTDAASIAATNDGEVFLLTADDAETGNTKDMRFRILKYSPDTKDWTLLGGTTMTSIFANDTHISAKIAVAPDGTPFFVYADYKNDKFVKVQYFDNETKQWSQPEAISAEESESVNIAFCDNGEAYICYVGANDNIVMLKYAAKK